MHYNVTVDCCATCTSCSKSHSPDLHTHWHAQSARVMSLPARRCHACMFEWRDSWAQRQRDGVRVSLCHCVANSTASSFVYCCLHLGVASTCADVPPRHRPHGTVSKIEAMLVLANCLAPVPCWRATRQLTTVHMARNLVCRMLQSSVAVAPLPQVLLLLYTCTWFALVRVRAERGVAPSVSNLNTRPLSTIRFLSRPSLPLYRSNLCSCSPCSHEFLCICFGECSTRARDRAKRELGFGTYSLARISRSIDGEGRHQHSVLLLCRHRSQSLSHPQCASK